MQFKVLENLQNRKIALKKFFNFIPQLMINMLKNETLARKRDFSPYQMYLRMTASNQVAKSNVITYFAHIKQ